MNTYKLKEIKYEKIVLFSVVLIFLLSHFWRVPPVDDPAGYIAMGKYIYSLGNAGYWMPRKAILLPLMVGAFWKLGLDHVLFGGILELLFSVGSIFLVYLIGRKVFDEKVGLLSAAFLSISPLYFNFGVQIFPRIPATFFGLLAVYYFLNNKQFLSGFFSALAFLGHFTLLLLYGVLFLFFILGVIKRTHTSKNIINFLIGSLLIFIPYLFSNLIFYRNLIFPILDSFHQMEREKCGWAEGFPGFFYIEYFWGREPIILFLSLIGVLLIIKKPDLTKVLILCIGAIHLLDIHITRTNSIRYTIPALPYLYMLSAFAFFQIYNFVKQRKRFVGIGIFILLFIYITFNYTSLIYLHLHRIYDMEDFYRSKTFIENGELLNGIKYIYKKATNIELSPYQQYLQENEKNMHGTVWVSDGKMVIYSNLRVTNMSHPIFKLAEVMQFQSKLLTADWILLDATGLLCDPSCNYILDKKCEEEKNKLIKTIISQFKAERYFTNSKGEFIGGIFKKLP